MIAIPAVMLFANTALAQAPAKLDGKVFTDQNGMTLYTFDKDARNKSNCYDKCAKDWPPFVAATGTKPTGEWTIVERKDGSKMWAYGGKPLYTFINDAKHGDKTGDGAGGVWHIATEN
jgi:predicted lipoprotein with Yx(FWY)xxD motif